VIYFLFSDVIFPALNVHHLNWIADAICELFGWDH